jgi:hypothetical protein
VPDVNAGKGKRTGRPPKDDSEKRVSLSLRISPETRTELDVAAKEENRSLTQLSEFALKSFLEARRRGDSTKAVAAAPPSAAPQSVGRQRSADTDQFSLQRLLAILEAGFGPQIAGVLCLQGYAMLAAELDSIAWSRDIDERTGPFPRVRARTGSAMRQRQIIELWDFLAQSSPAHEAEQSWLSDDPYVFAQVARAAKTVLHQLAPEGDPSPPKSPSGINRAEAVNVMKSFGEDAAYWAIDILTAEEPPGTLRRGVNEPERLRAFNEVGEADVTRLKQCLGETAVTRSKERDARAEWAWQYVPTEGQKG